MEQSVVHLPNSFGLLVVVAVVVVVVGFLMLMIYDTSDLTSKENFFFYIINIYSILTTFIYIKSLIQISQQCGFIMLSYKSMEKFISNITSTFMSKNIITK